MAFLCPSVGLLKFRKFTKLGIQPSQPRKTRTRVRNRGTSVSFGSTGSDASIASEGGFSALYGQVNAISDTEESEECAANSDEYFGGIYIGGGDAKKSQRSVREKPASGQPSDGAIFTRNPATLQSFTFFEESLLSCQPGTAEVDEEEIAEMDMTAKPYDQNTPLLAGSSAEKAPSVPKSTSSKVRYNLPNWVRQKRCLPTLDELDFDQIDTISLRSLSISSEMGAEDNNNNIVAPKKGLKSAPLKTAGKIPEGVLVKSPCSNKRNHSDDLCEGHSDNVQTWHPPHPVFRSHVDKVHVDVYSPKKTRRRESESTDDSVFIRVAHPQQQPALEEWPQGKLRPSKTSKATKSPSQDSLRRRSKKRDSFRKTKHLYNSGSNWSSSSRRTPKNGVGRSASLKDPENVGSLVRSKPLYMRATSEQALDPGAMKLRLESSTARKWRETNGSSPLSEVTNIRQPQSNMCLRMEIVQRPLIHKENPPQEKAAVSPRKTGDLRQQSLKLPAGKIRPTPQWSRQVNASNPKSGSLCLKAAEVQTSSRPANFIIKEEQIDTILGQNICRNKGETFLSKVNQRRSGQSQQTDPMEHRNLIKVAQQMSDFDQVELVADKPHSSGNQSNTDVNCNRLDEDPALVLKESLLSTTFQVKTSRREVLLPWKKASQENNKTEQEASTIASKTEFDVQEPTSKETETTQANPKKPLIHQPRFADNSLKEARIVSTSKTLPAASPEDETAPPLPPKMMKSASFAGTSQSESSQDSKVTSKPATRSATNVRALQTPLSQQERRKLRRSAPGNRKGGVRRVSAVEASRQDITEVVAAMKASLVPAKPTEKPSNPGTTNVSEKPLGEAEVLYDFEARKEDDISVRIGEKVTVMNKDRPDWLFVRKRCGQQEGFVPRIFLKLKVNEDVQAIQHNSAVSVARKVDLKQSSLNAIPEGAVCSQTQRPHTSNLKTTNKESSAPTASSGIRVAPSFDKTTDEGKQHCQQASKPNLRKVIDLSEPFDLMNNHKQNPGPRPRGVQPGMLIETYIVVNDYTGRDEDEVSVVEGEVIVVHSEQQHELDWMWVYVPRTEMFGFVPAFCARPLGFHYSDV